MTGSLLFYRVDIDAQAFVAFGLTMQYIARLLGLDKLLLLHDIRDVKFNLLKGAEFLKGLGWLRMMRSLASRLLLVLKTSQSALHVMTRSWSEPWVAT